MVAAWYNVVCGVITNWNQRDFIIYTTIACIIWACIIGSAISGFVNAR